MTRALLAAVLAAIALPLHAVELRVLSAGAVEPGVKPALAAFERASGHTVAISFAAAPALRAALRAPAVADVIIVPQGVLDELAATGSKVDGPRAAIGKVGVGVAVRPGVAAPDITSAETLKAALLGADVVVYNRASTGVWVERMLQRLGVADAVRPKSERFADGASVMRRLLAGTSLREFGFGAMTEIALFRDQGLRLVGPLPAALQNTTTYIAVPWPGLVPGDGARADAVAALMHHLQGSESRSQFANAGIEPTH
ncbi:MAG TPA: substrate-binding domain-containing protein [Caldimonas sp.]|nr:substrate-binding domain-containing protein [Caldimonas sp.]HEX4234675.1 substrate-binding domain-containing protein [Caldimonas sp.]